MLRVYNYCLIILLWNNSQPATYQVLLQDSLLVLVKVLWALTDKIW